MSDLFLMFYLGGVAAGIGPATGAKDRVVIQLLLTIGWPVLALGALLHLIVFCAECDE